MSTDRAQARSNQGASIPMSPYAVDVAGELHVAADVTNAITAASRDQLGLFVESETDDAIRAVANTLDRVAIDAAGGQGTGIRAGGDTAALQLRFSGTQPGPPTSGFHEMGMLYLDNQADLFLCKQDGDPGVWKYLD